jgi:hypothetical protein
VHRQNKRVMQNEEVGWCHGEKDELLPVQCWSWQGYGIDDGDDGGGWWFVKRTSQAAARGRHDWWALCWSQRLPRLRWGVGHSMSSSMCGGRRNKSGRRQCDIPPSRGVGTCRRRSRQRLSYLGSEPLW